MEVRFYAGLRQVVGEKTIQMEGEENGTILDLLGVIVKRYPGLQAKLLDEGEKPRAYIRIFVNGTDFALLPAGTETILNPGDEIDIFPPIGGGKG